MMTVENINHEFGSIMIIVPHQDDEILMTAGIINTAIEKKVPIHVVMVTNGDYGCSDFTIGRKRLDETVQGTNMLGLRPNQLTILGYADTGMQVEDSFLMHLYEEKDANKIYQSFCTHETYGLEGKYEYHMQKTGTHAPYSRTSVKNDLKDIIETVRPRNIFTTSEFDVHGDHAALYKFIVEILGELKDTSAYEVNLYTGIVHSNAGDEVWPKRDTKRYDYPDNFEIATSLKWEDRISFPVPECMVSEKLDDNLKYRSLLCYETALEPNAYEFLMAFIKEEEIFWKVRY